MKYLDLIRDRSGPTGTETDNEKNEESLTSSSTPPGPGAATGAAASPPVGSAATKETKVTKKALPPPLAPEHPNRWSGVWITESIPGSFEVPKPGERPARTPAGASQQTFYYGPTNASIEDGIDPDADLDAPYPTNAPG